jgi:four helix bundle protein
MRRIYEYDVFRLSHKLAIEIYNITKGFPREEIFGLTSQMRRSAYLIPMNLVEGASRKSSKEFAYFIDIAIGSCEEVRYQLFLSKDLTYINEMELKQMDGEYEKVKMMLTKLAKRIAVGGMRIAE